MIAVRREPLDVGRPIAELGPRWMRIGEHGVWQHVGRIEDADGVELRCPACEQHPILLYVMDARRRPEPMTRRGKSFETLTLRSAPPTIMTTTQKCRPAFSVHGGLVVVL